MYQLDSFGKRLKSLRLDKGYSQEHLAFYAGTCVKEISNLECGKGNPTLLSIASLAAALGVEPYELLMEESIYEQDVE